MAVKIKLARLGKSRNPQYRVIVADARTRRDGRSIETIGLYRPKEEPSFVQSDSERAVEGSHAEGDGLQIVFLALFFPTEDISAYGRPPLIHHL